MEVTKERLKLESHEAVDVKETGKAERAILERAHGALPYGYSRQGFTSCPHPHLAVNTPSVLASKGLKG